MSQLAKGKIKHGGLFGSSEWVIYEFKYERPTTEGEVKSINMYKDKEGDPLGKLEYAKNGSSVKLNVFNILDWSSTKYGIALLERFLKLMRKEKAAMIEHEMYDTDDKTHQKLSLFKDFGFNVESRGNMTGYSQYYLSLKLK
jgi:hypothetical protein